jgi:hypothetical protein
MRKQWSRRRERKREAESREYSSSGAQGSEEEKARKHACKVDRDEGGRASLVE